MDKKRINELADFFYSSNSVNDVPFRINISIGRYAGFDLNKTSFIKLLTLFIESKNIKEDSKNFVSTFSEDNQWVVG